MLRSLLFHGTFYLVTALFMIGGIPLFLAPRLWGTAALKLHARAVLWLLRVIASIRVEVRGRQNLPAGAAIVAAKHQSALDTIAPVAYLRDPAMIMKQELMSIPFYGWYSRKFQMIPVRREAGPAALRAMARAARSRIAEGREIFIFPEGTRRAPGASPAYKPGVVLLYEALDVPCHPVALNSGLFWPRRAWRLYPGKVIIEFLPPIPPGLPRAEFRARLQEVTEAATSRLLDEALASAKPPPVPASMQSSGQPEPRDTPTG